MEQEDSLGRRMCYRDGIHVPCPGENGGESEPVESADPVESQESQIADELGNYSIEDLQAALTRLGGEISDSRSQMTGRLASMIAEGNAPRQPDPREASGEGARNTPSRMDKAKASSTLASRVNNLVGKELSPQNVQRYRAALSALSLEELKELRESAAAVAEDLPGDEEEPHKYGCLITILPNSVASVITKWAKENIDPKHLGEGGLEKTPHVTIKYGLEDSSPGMTERVKNLVAGVRPFHIRLGGFSHFPGDSDEGSPLYVEVESEDLHELNLLVSSTFHCVDKHPSYVPHVCVAYVAQNKVNRYEDADAPFLGIDCKIDTLEWSPATGRKERIVLSKTGYTKSLLDSPLIGRKSLVSYAVKSVPPSPFRVRDEAKRRNAAAAIQSQGAQTDEKTAPTPAASTDTQNAPRVSDLLDPIHHKTNMTPEDVASLGKLFGGRSGVLLHDEELSTLHPDTAGKFKSEGVLGRSIIPNHHALTFKGVLVKHGGKLPKPSELGQGAHPVLSELYRVGDPQQQDKLADAYGLPREKR